MELDIKPEHIGTHQVLALLAQVGKSGMTTTDVALAFDQPRDHQYRSNRASQIMRAAEKQGLVRKGAQEPTYLHNRNPVRRWYITETGKQWVRANDPEAAAERSAALDQRMQESAARRAQALQQARDEGFGPGCPTHARYEKIKELRAVPCTLAEIGELFGITKERVRQIEQGINVPCKCAGCQVPGGTHKATGRPTLKDFDAVLSYGYDSPHNEEPDRFADLRTS